MSTRVINAAALVSCKQRYFVVNLTNDIPKGRLLYSLLGLPAGLSITRRKVSSETNKFIAEKQKLTHYGHILSEEHQKK